MHLEAFESFARLLLLLGPGDCPWEALKGMVQRRCRAGHGRFPLKLDQWYHSGLYLRVFRHVFPILHKHLKELVNVNHVIGGTDNRKSRRKGQSLPMSGECLH